LLYGGGFGRTKTVADRWECEGNGGPIFGPKMSGGSGNDRDPFLGNDTIKRKGREGNGYENQVMASANLYGRAREGSLTEREATTFQVRLGESSSKDGESCEAAKGAKKVQSIFTWRPRRQKPRHVGAEVGSSDGEGGK